MASGFDERARIQAVRAAFDQLLRPRLDEETRLCREQGQVFYRGRWMPQNEATRIHFMMARDSERTFFDLAVLLVLYVALFGAVLWRGPALLMKML